LLLTAFLPVLIPVRGFSGFSPVEAARRLNLLSPQVSPFHKTSREGVARCSAHGFQSRIGAAKIYLSVENYRKLQMVAQKQGV
jgi:hypothetical protein